jgi:GntR family transcriptional regulator
MKSNRPSRVSDAASLERDSTTSLYRQIASQLKIDIRSGLFAGNNKLPSEHQLTLRFGVSRVTVRQAMALLMEEGYVLRKQGKGTFVAGQKLQHDLHSMRGFYDSLVAQGVKPETRLLEFVAVLSPDMVPHGLAAPNGECFFLRRLYLVDGVPIAMVCAYLPPETKKISWQEANDYPIYGILEHLLNTRVVRSRVKIRAQAAGAKIGRELGLDPRAAILIMERESFSDRGQVKEHSYFYICPENYEFSLSAEGPLPISSALSSSVSSSVSSSIKNPGHLAG